jgi:hypothetical protein
VPWANELPASGSLDAGVDRLGEAEADRRVGVVGREVGAVGEDDVVEVGAEVAVAGAAAQHRRPHVAVGVGEARHDDPVAAIGDLVAGLARQRRADRRDVRAVDEDVRLRERPELVVHGDDRRVGDQRAAHDPGPSLR